MKGLSIDIVWLSGLVLVCFRFLQEQGLIVTFRREALLDGEAGAKSLALAFRGLNRWLASVKSFLGPAEVLADAGQTCVFAMGEKY